MLQTKSIQKRKLKNDGIRICIMRRPGENQDWDLWMPKLAPSHELLNKYKYENLSWIDFSKSFKKEVVRKQKKLIMWLCEASRDRNVTLLCWEEDPSNCHRKIIAESCKKMDEKIEVKIF